MSRSARPADYWSLTKPDVNVLIALTTAAGFCLSRPAQLHEFPFIRFAYTVSMARRLLLASIVYLPLIFILLVLDRRDVQT